jgi:hypothetical protein
MMDIMGATSTAAEAALTRSAPSRSARFLVFHSDVWLLPAFGSEAAEAAGANRAG